MNWSSLFLSMTFSRSHSLDLFFDFHQIATTNKDQWRRTKRNGRKKQQDEKNTNDSNLFWSFGPHTMITVAELIFTRASCFLISSLCLFLALCLNICKRVRASIAFTKCNRLCTSASDKRRYRKESEKARGELQSKCNWLIKTTQCKRMHNAHIH